MEKVRSFIAVLLPDHLRRRVWELIQTLKSVGSGVGWVAEENLHITMKFLGHLGSEELARVREGIAEGVAEGLPFTLSFSGLGAFPTSKSPRVLWVGLSEGQEPAIRLHLRLEEALSRRGFPREERPFHAHLTIGRVKRPAHLPGLYEATAAHAHTGFGSMEVRALHLMRSDLGPVGARYSIQAAYPFKGR